MDESACPLPTADPQTGLEALRQLIGQRSLLAALEVMHAEVGDRFQITLPGFRPAVLVGPEHNRSLLVSDRHKFSWRNESDPVVKLLRQGVLIVDGEKHDKLRALMDPLLYRRTVNEHVEAMWRYTDPILATWQEGETRDMLVEMRKVALLVLMGTLFKVDVLPDLERIWTPILKSIKYISPGLWIVWPNAPRFGYDEPLRQLDDYLYGLIKRRRAQLPDDGDLLGRLINAGLDDDLIRDQMLTMLIAGHDTSTALLAWCLYLLGRHAGALNKVKAEIDAVVGNDPPTLAHLDDLLYLDQVIKETLRLYPPIHIGNRRVSEDTVLDGYLIPAETRVMYSIYLSHRHPEFWEDPDQFRPERFDRLERRGQPPLTYVPFGAGPRNCIGAAFAQVEAKVILTRILQRFNLTLLEDKVSTYMGATLEPRPGVSMWVSQRTFGQRR